ncbi:hypothetical protein C0J52_16725 [Blattella germanica]|nr:hypothetical protein C0J52_16725 [Blattella germanica]
MVLYSYPDISHVIRFYLLTLYCQVLQTFVIVKFFLYFKVGYLFLAGIPRVLLLLSFCLRAICLPPPFAVAAIALAANCST